MADVNRDGNIINVGDNYRIEPGPALVKAVATEELLNNANTAEHYHAPIERPDGGTTFAKDSFGQPIIVGEEFHYLDHGGTEAEGKTVYYVYKKTPVNFTDEFLKGGERNPYYVAPEAREKDTDDRTHYDYIWREVATRATEEAAIEYAQRNAS